MVLLTGHRGPVLDREAKAAGIAQILDKPIRLAALGSALAAIVR